MKLIPKHEIVNLLSFEFASYNILDVFHCLDNLMLTEVYFFILSFLLFGQFYTVIIEIIDTQNTLVPNFFFNTMNFLMRQLYCLLFSMALLFALSEGRDHRLDHILRLRRRNLKEKFQPSKSYSPLNSALFRSKTQNDRLLSFLALFILINFKNYIPYLSKQKKI